MRAWLRQRRHPAEFRIAPPPRAAGLGRAAHEIALRLAALVPAASPSPAPPEAPVPVPVPAAETDVAFLADVVTAMFRLRKTLVDPATGRPTESSRRAFRHLETAWDVLRAAGFDVRDHKDEVIPDGHVGLVIAAFEPAPGLTRNRVIETLKPSVYHHDRMLQMGEVIVGTPTTDAPPEKPSPETP